MDKNEFSNIVDRLDANTTKEKEITKNGCKCNNETRVRTTFYMSKELHKRLKKKSYEDETSMSEIIENLIIRYL